MFAFFSECSDEILRELPDEAVLSFSQRRPSAFAELVRRYDEAFMRKAYSILRDKDDAQDAVQDTFVRMYQHASRFERVEGASFKSWAYRILLNTVFTRYQRQKRLKEHTVGLGAEYYEVLPDTDMRQFEKDELHEYIISILVRMPETFSRTLRLYFLEGRSQKEIADLEGTSVGAIKTRMHRARKEFRAIEKSL